MVNPCDLIPKKNTMPIEYHVINHQSVLIGSSINDRIDKTDFMISYENIPYAMKWIRELDEGCTLIKQDIKEAY